MLRPGLFLLLLIASPAFANIGDIPIGARSHGMGNSVIAQSDRYALFHNVAGIASLSEPSLFTSYHSYYGFDGLSTFAFGLVLPLRKELVSGFSVQRFGDKIYNELSFGLGVAHRINRISLGLKVGYRQLAVTASNVSLSRKAFVVEMGGIAQLSSTVYFGAHLSNLTQSHYSGENTEQVPTVLRAGFTYIPTKSLRLSTEFVKDTDHPASIRAGLEYEVVRQLFVRTGIATKPYTNHAGVGFVGGNFAVDYAVTSHPQLGWSHHFTLAYAFKKTEESQVVR